MRDALISARPHFGTCNWCGKDIIRQRLDFVLAEFLAKGRHLRGGTTLGDGLDGLRLAQPLQVFGQQGGADGSQTVCAVAGRAMRRVEILGGGCGHGDAGKTEHANAQCLNRRGEQALGTV